jgi:hypothetical protein
MPTFHGIVWDFGVPEITDVRMDVIIHADAPGRPAVDIVLVYLQLYDFRLFVGHPEFGKHGIYSYHGLQTDVFDPNRRVRRGRGLLFSRFQSSDAEDVRVAAGGWAELPTAQQIKAEGGAFVGVRNTFSWGKGTYRLQFAPIEENASGIWYEFSATNVETGEAASCGALRFPTIDNRRPLLPNLGTTWIEVCPRPFQLSDFPTWHVTLTNVVANNGTLPAQAATARYSDKQAPALNSDISLASPPVAVDFRVGKGVKRTTPNGTKLRFLK